MRSSGAFRALALLLALILAVPVAAEPAGKPSKADVKAAEDHFARGNKHYEAGEYSDAVKEFTRAYELSKIPALLFNIAQSHRLDGGCADALRLYKQYLELDPQSVNRVDVETRIAQMERCIAEQKKVAAPPPPPPVVPDTLPPPPPPPAPRVIDRAPSGGGSGLRVTGLVLGGLGLAAGGAGVFFAFRAKSASQEVTDACAIDCDWDSIADKDASGRTSGRLALILWAGGGALFTTGVILFVVGVGKGKSRKEISATPTPGGAVIRVGGRF